MKTSLLAAALLLAAHALPQVSAAQEDSQAAQLRRLVELQQNLFQQGVISYLPVLAAEEASLRHLLSHSSGAEADALRRQLQENYTNQLKILEANGDADKLLAVRLRLQALTEPSRPTVLELCRQAAEQKLEQYRQGSVSYDEVWKADLAYFRAAEAAHDKRAPELRQNLKQNGQKLLELYRQMNDTAKEAELLSLMVSL